MIVGLEKLKNVIKWNGRDKIREVVNTNCSSVPVRTFTLSSRRLRLKEHNITFKGDENFDISR